MHAWAEYWDDNNGWVQVDPTWGSTSGGLNYFEKLDFNHITFVQKGLSSTSPAPAGAYKKPQDASKKSVNVEFATDLPNATVNPVLDLAVPVKIISAIPAKIEARIVNGGTTSIFTQKVTLEAQKLTLAEPKEIDIPLLPPFANRTYTFRLNTSGFFTRSVDNLILSYAGAQVSKQTHLEPFYSFFLSPIAAFMAIGILTIISLAFLIFKKLHKKPLR